MEDAHLSCSREILHKRKGYPMLFRRRKNESLKRYRQIRKVGRDLAQQIMEQMPQFVLTRAAKDLKLLAPKRTGARNMLVLDSEEDSHFLMDRCFYDIYWEGKNLVEHFMDSEAYGLLSEEEQRVVQGMSTAYYSLFEVTDTARRERTLALVDLLGEETHVITDINMSRTGRKGLLLATRIQQVEGMYITGGVACPFRPDQKPILLAALAPTQTHGRTGKKRKGSRRLERWEYSAHFFREYKRMGGIEFRTKDELPNRG